MNDASSAKRLVLGIISYVDFSPVNEAWEKEWRKMALKCNQNVEWEKERRENEEIIEDAASI
jgi:hypothetical protein